MTELIKIVNGERIPLSQEEIVELNSRVLSTEQINELMLNELRSVRDGMLNSTDWWVMPDRTATQAQLDYRQALRDITESYSSLEDVVWPDEPE